MPDNKLQSLTEIFNQKFFRIPDFQRGYSWEETQLNDFYEDLINLKEDRIHYTGLLTVEPVKRNDVIKSEKWQEDLWLLEKGLTAYYVIDGQQRLTTTIIFINELLKRFDEQDGLNFDSKEAWVNRFLYKRFGEIYKSFIFGYEKDNPSDEYFKAKILEQHSSSFDKVPEQTLYTANLKYAKKYFKTRFNPLNKQELEELFKRIVNRFKFNFYEIDDELDVYVTFETMNNRGKSLTTLELLKNRLIYISTLLNVEQGLKDRLRKDINETWKTIYEFLGKSKNNPLDDDEFLFNHWIMYFKYDRNESAAYAKFLLNEKFTAKNVLKGDLEISEIKSYIDSLAECVKAWFYLFNPAESGYSDDAKEWLQKLNRLGMGAFPPLLMAAVANETRENKVLELLQAAERFVFLVFRLSRRSSNTKNSHFYRLANMYYWQQNYFDGTITNIDKVIADIVWNISGESGEGEAYQYHGWFNADKFREYIKETFQQEEGYYTWNGLKYFLYEYELFLQEKRNPKISWTDFNKREKEDTIEHIYPQTPTEESWIIPFEQYNKKQRKHLLNSLGNLLLLGHSKNSSLQNRSFEYKRRYQNAKGDYIGYFNGSYSEIDLTAYDKWTPEQIMDRGSKMLKFMEDRWQIDFADWGIEKDHLLGELLGEDAV